MSDKNIIHNSTSLTQVPTAITADILPGMLLICTDFDSAILFQSTPVETRDSQVPLAWGSIIVFCSAFSCHSLHRDPRIPVIYILQDQVTMSLRICFLLFGVAVFYLLGQVPQISDHQISDSKVTAI
jgi:hypothetical protein